jgi:hypothetical protein
MERADIDESVPKRRPMTILRGLRKSCAWWISRVGVGLLGLGFATATFAYEDDVHYGLIRWLALQAGFPASEAAIVAVGDKQVDGAALDAVSSARYFCFGGADAVGSNQVRDYHFASDMPAPNPPSVRIVNADSYLAYLLAMDRVKNPHRDSSENLVRFGMRVHAYQDSWSHHGVPDIPTILLCNADYAWGHPATRGRWFRHDADLTFMYPADAAAMAMRTFDLLCLYRKEVDAQPCTVRWDDLSTDVGVFNAAKTKKEKRDWFIAHGFTDVDFVGGTTLPEWDWPATPVPYSGGFPPSNMRAIADDEVNRLFAKFFSSWATTRQFDSLVLNYVSPQQFGGDVTTGERKAADRVVIRQTLQFWRALDHGSVAPLGHNVTDMNGNARRALATVFGVPGMLEPYKSADEAFIPMNAMMAPFVVIGTSSRSGTPLYLALARFRHTPHDTLVVSAQRMDRQLRITSIQSLIEH